MSFLEAMAYGMIVIAPDTPTHNEYIVSGYNGYLYNLKKITEIKFEKLDEMINNVIKTVENGYQNWLDSIDKIINFIEEEPQQIYLENKERLTVLQGNILKEPIRRFLFILKFMVKKILWKILYQ
jgi:glycosyltransferase involved in cell wall biosynthesis